MLSVECPGSCPGSYIPLVEREECFGRKGFAGRQKFFRPTLRVMTLDMGCLGFEVDYKPEFNAGIRNGDMDAICLRHIPGFV